MKHIKIILKHGEYHAVYVDSVNLKGPTEKIFITKIK